MSDAQMRLSGYWKRRLLRHALLAAFTLSVVWCATFLAGDTLFRVSMGTAYAGLVLLGLSLMLGPWNVLRRRPNPLSSDLRRDLGIWAALAAFAHTIVGLQVHVRGRPWEYFLWPRTESSRLFPFRYDGFGASNYVALGSLLILVLLLSLSNDVALRRLGSARWKSLQRWNYGAFGLMLVHGALAQVLERRALPFVLLLGGTVALVLALQLAGRRGRRGGQ